MSLIYSYRLAWQSYLPWLTDFLDKLHHSFQYCCIQSNSSLQKKVAEVSDRIAQSGELDLNATQYSWQIFIDCWKKPQPKYWAIHIISRNWQPVWLADIISSFSWKLRNFCALSVRNLIRLVWASTYSGIAPCISSITIYINSRMKAKLV